MNHVIILKNIKKFSHFFFVKVEESFIFICFTSLFTLCSFLLCSFKHYSSVTSVDSYAFNVTEFEIVNCVIPLECKKTYVRSRRIDMNWYGLIWTDAKNWRNLFGSCSLLKQTEKSESQKESRDTSTSETEVKVKL